MGIDDELKQHLFPHTFTLARYALSLLAKDFQAQAPDEAQDVVQTVFIAAWRHWETIEHRYEKKVLLQWLMTSTLRECCRRMKKPPREQVDIEDIDDFISLVAEFPGDMEHVQTLDLREMIAQLPQPFGQIIFAKEFFGLSFQEVAKKFGVTRERMYQLHALALVKLERVIIEARAQQEVQERTSAKGVANA